MPRRIGSAARPVSLRSICCFRVADAAGAGTQGSSRGRSLKTWARLPNATPPRQQVMGAGGSPSAPKAIPAARESRPDCFRLRRLWTEPGCLARRPPGRSLNSCARPSLRHRWLRVGRAILYSFPRRYSPARRRIFVYARAACAAYLTSSTSSNASSTGVARPKIETATLTRCFSKSSSSTVPLNEANGPALTFTESPIS